MKWQAAMDMVCGDVGCRVVCLSSRKRETEIPFPYRLDTAWGEGVVTDFPTGDAYQTRHCAEASVKPTDVFGLQYLVRHLVLSRMRAGNIGAVVRPGEQETIGYIPVGFALGAFHSNPKPHVLSPPVYPTPVRRSGCGHGKRGG